MLAVLVAADAGRLVVRNGKCIDRELFISIASKLALKQGRVNHLGAPYQRQAGALFAYAELGFSLGVHFSSPKKLIFF